MRTKNSIAFADTEIDPESGRYHLYSKPDMVDLYRDDGCNKLDLLVDYPLVRGDLKRPFSYRFEDVTSSFHFLPGYNFF